MVTANFYNYEGHPNTVNKELGEETTVNGILRDVVNVFNPVFTLRYNSAPFPFNYCFIPTFGRYYFVDSVIILNSEKIEIRLRVDVLFTYKDIILNSTATITKSENGNKYLSNRSNVVDVRPNIRKLDFPNEELLDETGSIIMVTIKGNV